MKYLTKQTRPILFFNILYVGAFGFYAVAKENYEFLFYVSIVIFFVALLLIKQKKLGLSIPVLWGLSFWGLLHMMGGNVPIDGSVLYNFQLIPIVLKYDQFVHLFGFATATVVGYQLLKPNLKEKVNWTTVSVLIIMIGLGIGALNEILEFIAVLTMPHTNVGGYYNTLWDLVFDLFGAILAIFYINWKKKR